MARSSFTITNRKATRDVITPLTRRAATELMQIAMAATPVRHGALRGGWRVVPGKAPGAFIVENSVPYGRYVEFGTVNMPADHMMGIAAMAIRGRYAVR